MSDGDDRPLPPEGLTYYQLLGVAEGASEDDIRSAYRQLIKVYHPDQWDHWASDDVARRLRDAYDVLTDPRARQRYNQEGHEKYTGESSPSFSDTQDWISSVSRHVDVDEPATIEEVEKGSEGSIDVSGGFETSDESVSAEEIFDDMDVEVTPSSFNDVQEEAVEDPRETPDYAGETEVESIEETEPRQRERTTNANVSYEEQVNRKARTTSRRRDPTVETDPDERVTDSSQLNRSKQTESTPITERVSTTVSAVVSRVNSHLSDDVLSRAVRAAWVARIGVVVAAIALGGVGVVLSGQVPHAAADVLSAILTSPAVVVPVALLLTSLVFGADQLRTDTSTERGAINVAQTPSVLGGSAVFANLLGASGFWYMASNGDDPFAVLGSMANGVLTTQVWIPSAGAGVNGAITALVAGVFAVGFLFGVGVVSRFVWYARYVDGYFANPLWWDAAMAIPAVAVVLMVAGGHSSVPLPLSITAPVADAVPVAATQLGVAPGQVSRTVISYVALASPALVGIPLYFRVGVERLVRKFV